MSDCLFCKIVAKEIPSTIVYDDTDIIAFKDINPIAPVHILVIPKKHLQSLNDVTEQDAELIGRIHVIIIKLAEEFNIAESGYRVVTNIGSDGGQVIGHLHFHLIGGQPLKTRMG